MIRGVAHVCFVVRDLGRSIAWYGKLGLPVAFEFRRKETNHRYGVYLKVGHRTFIELFEGEAAATPENVSYKHFCLEVTDMKTTVAALRETGIEVTEPKLGMDQSWQAWLTDPDGHRIELHQYTPDSWQMPHL